MWGAVSLCTFALVFSATSATHSVLQHDFNVADYISARDWQPVGLKVLDLEDGPTVSENDRPADDEAAEDAALEDLAIEGATTLNECSSAMNLVASLPMYMREILLNMVMNASNTMSSENDVDDDHLSTYESESSTYEDEEDGDMSQISWPDEAAESYQPTEEQQQKLVNLLKADGLSDDEVQKVVHDSQHLGHLTQLPRRYYIRRPRCVSGRYFCRYSRRYLIFRGYVLCCRNGRFPRLYRSSRRRRMCFC